MVNEEIEAMIRRLEEFETGGRTGVHGGLVTDCETCGEFSEACAGCRIRSGEEVRAMIVALRWAQTQTGTPASPEPETPVDEPEPSDGMGPEIDDENGMSEAEFYPED